VTGASRFLIGLVTCLDKHDAIPTGQMDQGRARWASVLRVVAGRVGDSGTGKSYLLFAGTAAAEHIKHWATSHRASHS
jgi:hypothetical protein